jgi:CDP-4-dehydro-6-deoxyglucose reductase, E3
VQPAAPEKKRGIARMPVRVLHVERPSESLVLLRLERPPQYSFEAGQFLYVYRGDLRRAYSIASAPEDPHLELGVKRVDDGPMSTALYDLEPGAQIEITRALGAFRFESGPDVPVVFLATGTGVAPFRSMLRVLHAKGDARPLWLFLGSREAANLPYHAEFEQLSRTWPAFRYVPVLSKGALYWPGERGWIQEALLKRFPHPRNLDAYVCGIKRMVDDVRTLLREKGLESERVHVERYD